MSCLQVDHAFRSMGFEIQSDMSEVTLLDLCVC